MKKIIVPICLGMAVLFVSSCKEQQVYADQLKEHNLLIEDYLERENVVVLDEFPADSVFAANEYVKTESDLYFQLISKGDQGDTVAIKDNVVMRYYKHDLSETPDTIFNLDTDDSAYPTEFQYGNYGDTQACIAWHEAVGYMKYSGAEARLIVPSKLGFASDRSPVLVPNGYFIRIKFR